MRPGLREAAPEDAAAIETLLVDAFGGDEEAALVRRLRKARLVEVELVAGAPEGPCHGHVLLSHLDVVADQRRIRAVALAPLAVAEAERRQGLGAALVAAALARSEAEAVFVLGDPAYYCRFGFSARPCAPFEAPFRPPHFMALALAPGALNARSGRVTYPPAFGL